jgi:hypothetical protein
MPKRPEKPAGTPVATETPALLADQVAELKRVFPEAVAEGKVDFEKLKATLGEIVDDRPGRYSFTWAGRRDRIRLLQTPSRATLLPCRRRVQPPTEPDIEPPMHADERRPDSECGLEFPIGVDQRASAVALFVYLRPLNLTREVLFVCRDKALDDEAAANLALQCRLRTTWGTRRN